VNQIHIIRTHDFESFACENVNIGEPKEGTHGKGLVPFVEGFMRWKTHERVRD